MTEPACVGFWIRFVAFLIDSVFASILLIPVSALFLTQVDLAAIDPEIGGAVNDALNTLLFNFGVQTVVIAIVFILFWQFRSATPGKMLLSARIVDAKTLGKTTPGQNIIRYVGYYVSLIPLGLGFIWIAFDPRKQGWHDKLAGTLVIRDSPDSNS